MTPKEAALELRRRKMIAAGIASLRERSLASLSDKQRAFVVDDSKRKLAVTSRQSGKTHDLLEILTETALKKHGSKSLYIAPTRQAARDIIWGRLIDWFTQNKIEIDTNGTRLEITVISTKSTIRLTGISHKDSADRQRGNVFDLVVVDEAAVYGSTLLQYLIQDVLDPALLVKNGTLVLVSTPGLLMSGYFYELAIGLKGGFSRHHWTLYDNPALADVDAYLERKLAENGWTRDEPTFRREYLGEWCQDSNSGVYRVSPDNIYTDLPDGAWHHVIGVDLGYNDEAAFTVLAWRDDDPVLRVVYADGASELTVSAIADRIKELRDRFEPRHIVCDAGALGKTIVEEFRQRHGLHIEAADKKDKPSAIRVLNSDLTKKLLMMPNGRLYEQMSALRWHPDYIGLKEQDGLPNDMCDATLYAFRKCYHYLEEIRKPKPKPGTDDYLRMVAQDHRERVKEELQVKRHEAGGWEKDMFGVTDIFEPW